MGKETKTFRQTKRSGGSDNSNQNYAKINRQGPYNKGGLLKENSMVDEHKPMDYVSSEDKEVK